jgi:hypothetical protein
LSETPERRMQSVNKDGRRPVRATESAQPSTTTATEKARLRCMVRFHSSGSRTAREPRVEICRVKRP